MVYETLLPIQRLNKMLQAKLEVYASRSYPNLAANILKKVSAAICGQAQRQVSKPLRIDLGRGRA
jgi:hypothetical protein